MEHMRKGLKVVHLVLLSLAFLLLTSMAVGQVFGGDNFFALGNLLFLFLYLLFGLALVQYIRKRDMGWHHFFLSLVWVGLAWLIILITLFFPMFEEMFGGSGEPAVIYARMAEQLIALMERVDMEDNPQELMQLLFKLIVMFQLSALLAVLFFFPLFIYGLRFFRPFFREIYDRYPVQRIGTGLIVVWGLFLVYRILFGGLTSDVIAANRYEGFKSVPGPLSWVDKWDNLQWAMGDIQAFLGTLHGDLPTLAIELIIFASLAVSLLIRRLNVDYTNLLANEYA